jgi:hypothetical protein
MDKDGNKEPILNVVFYKTESGNEPVRDWLRDLPKADRQAIGEDIKTAQYGWPLGMPLILRSSAVFGKCGLILQLESQRCFSRLWTAR